MTIENLKQIAEIQGFGYKTANLELLKNAIQNPSVGVPLFYGISSHQIIIALGEERWQTILVNWRNVQTILTRKKELDTEVRALLQNIRSTIQQGIHIEIPEKLTTPLIIRSTGMEDSDELSNAGGNLSIPYVNGSGAAIDQAAMEVLASYFSEKSIQQRLDAGDPKLCNQDEQPLIPILIQEMVEPIVNPEENKITYSGVAITCSHDLGVGFSRIIVGVGSNEGVVASTVPVDTIVVGSNGSIYREVMDKKTMVTCNQHQQILEHRKTPITLRGMPALPDGVVKKIKSALDEIHQLYGKPMDVEFTVQKHGQDWKIFILQARPLIENDRHVLPSYVSLALEEQLRTQGKQVISGNVIVPRLDVRYLVNSTESIIAPSINDALTAYQRLSKTAQDRLKVVVINQPCPDISHEALVFRGSMQCLPVIALNDTAKFNKAKKLLSQASENKIILIDPQQGNILETQDTKQSLKSGIHKGLFSYPFRQLTLNNEFTKLKNKLPINIDRHIEKFQNNLQSALYQLKGKINTVPEHVSLNEGESFTKHLRQLMNKIKLETNSVKQNLYLGSILWMVNHYTRQVKSISDNSILLDYMQLGQEIINIVLRLSNMDPCVDTAERRLNIQCLSGLLYGCPSATQMNTASLTQIRYQCGLMAQKGLQRPSQRWIDPSKRALLAIGSQVALTDEVKQKWRNFIEYNHNKLPALTEIVVTLHRIGMLPEFINFFIQSNDNIGSFKIEEILRDIKYGALGKIQLNYNTIEHLEARLNEFTADASHQQVQQQLEKITEEFLSSLVDFQSLSYLEKLSLYKTLDKLIDVWDRSIKSYKDNPTCTPILYYQAVQRFYNCFVQPILSSPSGIVDAHIYQNWQNYVNIPQLLTQVSQNDKTTMEPSINFDVSSLLASRHISSTGLVNQDNLKSDRNIQPATVEDCFTLCHQALLDFLALKKQEVLSLSKTARSCVNFPLRSCITFPFIKYYEKDRVIKIEPQQLGCDSTGLTLSYCVPLNVHSAFFTVQFNKKQTQATVDIKIHGSGLQSVYYPGLLARAAMMVPPHQEGLTLEGRPTLKYIENGEGSPYCGAHIRLQVSAESMPQFMTQQLKEFMTEASGGSDVLLETRWDRLVHNKDSYRYDNLKGQLPDENICLRYLQYILQDGTFDPALFSDSIELNNTLLNFISIHPTYREHNALKLSIATGQLAAIARFMDATGKGEPTITCLKAQAIYSVQPGTVNITDNVACNAVDHALKIIQATLPKLSPSEASPILSFIKQCPEIKKHLDRDYLRTLEPAETQPKFEEDIANKQKKQLHKQLIATSMPLVEEALSVLEGQISLVEQYHSIGERDQNVVNLGGFGDCGFRAIIAGCIDNIMMDKPISTELLLFLGSHLPLTSSFADKDEIKAFISAHTENGEIRNLIIKLAEKLRQHACDTMEQNKEEYPGVFADDCEGTNLSLMRRSTTYIDGSCIKAIAISLNLPIQLTTICNNGRRFEQSFAEEIAAYPITIQLAKEHYTARVSRPELFKQATPKLDLENKKKERRAELQEGSTADDLIRKKHCKEQTEALIYAIRDGDLESYNSAIKNGADIHSLLVFRNVSMRIENINLLHFCIIPSTAFRDIKHISVIEYTHLGEPIKLSIYDMARPYQNTPQRYEIFLDLYHRIKNERSDLIAQKEDFFSQNILASAIGWGDTELAKIILTHFDSKDISNFLNGDLSAVCRGKPYSLHPFILAIERSLLEPEEQLELIKMMVNIHPSVKQQLTSDVIMRAISMGSMEVCEYLFSIGDFSEECAKAFSLRKNGHCLSDYALNNYSTAINAHFWDSKCEFIKILKKNTDSYCEKLLALEEPNNEDKIFQTVNISSDSTTPQDPSPVGLYESIEKIIVELNQVFTTEHQVSNLIHLMKLLEENPNVQLSKEQLDRMAKSLLFLYFSDIMNGHRLSEIPQKIAEKDVSSTFSGFVGTISNWKTISQCLLDNERKQKIDEAVVKVTSLSTLNDTQLFIQHLHSVIEQSNQSSIDAAQIRYNEIKLTGLIDELEAKKEELSETNYNSEEMSQTVRTMTSKLENAAEVFFLAPTPERFSKFKKDCSDTFQEAKQALPRHSDVWFAIHPIIRAILGVLAALTVIPALVVTIATTQGYRGTFFRTPTIASPDKVQVSTKDEEIFGCSIPLMQ